MWIDDLSEILNTYFPALSFVTFALPCLRVIVNPGPTVPVRLGSPQALMARRAPRRARQVQRASCDSTPQTFGNAYPLKGTLKRVGLADVIAPEALVEPQGRYLTDLMGRGVVGTAEAVVFPSTVDEVAAVMRWCYENDTPLTARGGGTGLAGARSRSRAGS